MSHRQVLAQKIGKKLQFASSHFSCDQGNAGIDGRSRMHPGLWSRLPRKTPTVIVEEFPLRIRAAAHAHCRRLPEKAVSSI
jgi:hypothetical protein